MTRTCLLIALPFPPDGPIGASIRTVGFAKYLPKHGWQPTVLSGPYVGPGCEAVAGIERLGALGGERPAGHHPPGWRDWLRPWLVPDRYLAWVPRAVRQGLAWLAAHPGSPIISEGPTHAAHLVAWRLHRHTGVPWLADFADPWTGNPFAPRRPWPMAACESWLERQVLLQADHVTVATPELLPRFGALRGDAGVTLLENGFDSAAFAGLTAFEAGQRLIIRHLGQWYGRRSLQPLLDALSQAPAGGRPVTFEQIGGEPLNHPLCQWRAAVAHGEAVALMSRSEILVLVPGARYALPTKLYEYAASGRPILNLGDPDGEAARWIKTHQAGVTLAVDDAAGIASQVQAWRVLAAVPGTGLSPARLAAYDRQALAGALASRLEAIA